MKTKMNCMMHLKLVVVLLVCVHADAQRFDYPTANPSTRWKNNDVDIPRSVRFTDGSRVRSILLRGTLGPTFACGFYCNGNCEGYLFAVFVVQTNSASGIVMPSSGFPQVVWSANRNQLVKENATLDFTAKGDLVLTDADGRLIWSTNTAGKGVGGLSLTESGNLMVVAKSSKRRVVWQSFDHPTDVLLPGQLLRAGHKLVGNVSPTNTTEGPFYLSILPTGLAMFASAAPPQVYFRKFVAAENEKNTKAVFARYDNRSLGIYVAGRSPASSDQPDALIPVPEALSSQYIRVDSDGHLRTYEWRNGRWRMVSDLLSDELMALSACDYPGVCGDYGICTNGQCSCPKGMNASDSFSPINEREPNLGCSPPPTFHAISACNATGTHFLELKQVSYFNYIDRNAAVSQSISGDECQKLCVNKCSCQAALFQYGRNVSEGSCFLPSKLFSLRANDPHSSHYNSFAFLKL